MASQFENQQKRITFLSLHGNLMSTLKQVPEVDVTKHNQLVQYIYLLVDELFIKYPLNGKGESKSVDGDGAIKTEEIPL